MSSTSAAISDSSDGIGPVMNIADIESSSCQRHSFNDSHGLSDRQQQQTEMRRSHAAATAVTKEHRGRMEPASATTDDRRIRISRQIVYAILLILGIVGAVLALLLERHEQRQDGETQAETLSLEIVTAAASRFVTVASAFHAASDVVQSYAQVVDARNPDPFATPTSSFVTIPNFEGLVATLRDATDLRTIVFAPVVSNVTNNDRTAWETYAAQHYPHWTAQSAAVLEIPYDPNEFTIAPHIYEFASDSDNYGTAPTAASPPYAPVWQISPFSTTPSSSSSSNPSNQRAAGTVLPLINGNLLSNAVVKHAYEYAHIKTSFTVSKTVADTTRLDDTLRQIAGDDSMNNRDDDHDDGPVAFVLHPIVNTASTLSATNPEASIGSNAIGTLLGVLSWTSFFENILDHDDVHDDLIVSLGNSCGQRFVFRVLGSQATYVGSGDNALSETGNTDSDYIVKRTLLDAPSDAEPSIYTLCEYELRVYASADLLESHRTGHPWMFAAAILGLFLVATLSFLLYDVRVQRLRSIDLEKQQQRQDMANSLFPDTTDFYAIQSLHRRNSTQKVAHVAVGSSTKQKPKEETLKDHDQQPATYRLKHYLSEDSLEESFCNVADRDMSAPAWLESTHGPSARDNGHANYGITQAGKGEADSKPIADLFPNTTVMFADIAGFTAWSSVREPSQVFTLLETVYRGFDRTGQRRDVFKVETVGDCYVAVAGLTEGKNLHATTMCLFAKDCVTLFTHLVARLEVLLGPDTADLGIRVGLHSGPVTAGVLRGDKSRFQLFGDTVNTAARIETTGMRNRIHISHDTAEQLHADGKSHWIRKRTDTVVAKGKGELQTFWLLTDAETQALATTPNANDGATLQAAPLPLVRAIQPRLAKNMKVDAENGANSLPPKIQRLVDWNVDVLKRLLQKVEARRLALATKGGSQDSAEKHSADLARLEQEMLLNNYVLDEVQEIIELPQFDHAAKYEGSVNKIRLPKQVEDQLRQYVSSIAAMHRGNPFHNFEHASHVMMSVSKLLSRIIAPSEVDNREASTLHDHTYGITSDPLTQFAVVLAALVHDVDHSGVSNFQLIQEKSKVATVFRNKSVAEQNSIVLAWERLMEPRFLTLRRYIYSNPADASRFRALMVNTVLATDIFDKELSALRKNRWDKAFRPVKSLSTQECESDERNRKATIVIEHLIQASDVSHTMQHWHVYQKWNERLFHEMTTAFRAGRMGKDPAVGWYQGELGFFDNYIIPLAKKLKECGVFGVSSDEYLNYALENRREWSAKGEEIVAKMILKYKEGEE